MKPISSSMLLAFWSIYLLQLLPLLLTFNLLWFQSSIVSSSVTRNETDHLALLKFKESISDPYKFLASWNSSNHFCKWPGILCGRRHQRVTGLKLGGHGLHGIISPHIGNLSFLRILDFNNNSFHGEIPTQIGHLFRLQILKLSYNFLTGEIPINLTTCSKLRQVIILQNNLSGKIPKEIGSLVKLKLLVLEENNLTGPIPASITNISSLEAISLAANNLEGVIPEEIGHLNLTFLAIGGNKLSGKLPASLFIMSSLIEFSVTDNQFKGSLPANMFLNLPNLQIFDFGGNQFSGPIPTSIANASLIQELDIPDNRFVGQIPSLGKLQDLLWLNLGTNMLGSNSFKDWEFLESLTNCTRLLSLTLIKNNFGGPLPNFVGNLSNQLEQLHLEGNSISGSIPSTLGNLVGLIALGMDNNKLTSIIPTSLGKLPRMQVLFLNGNKFSGEIPASMGNLSQLSNLDLSKNNLEGNIPPSISNCHNLQKLDFSKNNLTGSIPPGLLSLSSLTILLNLSQNSLSGSLPVEVGKLTNIGIIDVSKNHLSGDIPRTIEDCTSLEYLYMQRNSFHGIIPSTLASLKGLRHLDLSQNNLSGSIPKSLQNISDLEYLNFSFNMLDGEVPTEGVFHNASAISVGNNSNLCGGISALQLPPCPMKVMRQSKHRHSKLIVVVPCVVAFLFFLSSSFAIYQMRKRNRKSSCGSPTIEQLPKVSYQSLHNATDGFSISKLIGSGSFGSVFIGNLEPEGKIVAIKVLNLQKKGAHKTFIAECNALKNIRHRNLVKILTCCSSTDYNGNEFKALVFEYMANGSLEKWLHPTSDSTNEPRTLQLNQRLNIVIDVASLLHYLHHESKQPIVHCDLKPSNVLLDSDMVAHVSDFGLARLLSTIEGISSKQSSTIGIKGTIGYAPPEYGMGAEVSRQGEMYSFGILVLEMLTGKIPTDEIFKDGYNLHNYVKIALPNNLLQILDPTIIPKELEQAKEDGDLTLLHPKVEKCLLSLFTIGLSCSVEHPNERMAIVDVARTLNLVINDFLATGTTS